MLTSLLTDYYADFTTNRLICRSLLLLFPRRRRRPPATAPMLSPTICMSLLCSDHRRQILGDLNGAKLDRHDHRRRLRPVHLRPRVSSSLFYRQYPSSYCLSLIFFIHPVIHRVLRCSAACWLLCCNNNNIALFARTCPPPIHFYGGDRWVSSSVNSSAPLSRRGEEDLKYTIDGRTRTIFIFLLCFRRRDITARAGGRVWGLFPCSKYIVYCTKQK